MFVLVVAASYFLAASSLQGLLSATIFSSPRGFLLLFVAPLSLTLFLSFFTYSLVSHTSHSGRASRFGRKIFAFFSVLIVVTGLAITLISGRFTGIAVSNWMSGGGPGALRAARDISDLYQHEREQVVERVAFRFLNGLSIVNQRARRRDWMQEIRVVDAYAVACQVYREDSSGEESGYEAVIETGDMDFFFPRGRLSSVRDGFFPRTEDAKFLRYGKLVRYSNETYVCVYTSMVPENFFEKDALIGRVYGESRVIEAFDHIMPYLSIWIFFMFCLPPVMVIILIGYVVILRITRPVIDAAEYSRLLVDGNLQFRSIPHADDESTEILKNLNALAEKPAQDGKRGDKKASLRL